MAFPTDHVQLCLGAPLFDLLVLGHSAYRVDVRPHHWAHLRQGFLKDCLLLGGFILDTGISQDWQECSHSSRNDLHDHNTFATLRRAIVPEVPLSETGLPYLVTKCRHSPGAALAYL